MRFWIHTGVLLVWLLAAVFPNSQAIAQASSPVRTAGWSPEQADELITTLRAWVDGQGRRATQENNLQVAYAAAEAIRRYPRAEQRPAWEWERAYSLHMAGDSQACGLYAGLIQQAISAQRILPENISDWLEQQEPRLMLASAPLDASAGYNRVYMFELAGWNLPVLYFSAQRLGDGRYTVWPLCEKRPLGVGRSITSQFSLADLTGDGLSEVLLIDYGNRGSRFYLSAYNLAFRPPLWIELPISESFSNGSWRIQPPEAGQGGSIVIVEGSEYLQGGCLVVMEEHYAWNGFQMQTVAVQAGLDALNGNPVCAQNLFNLWLERLSNGQFWLLPVARELINTWPADCAADQVDHPFSLTGCPADVRDEARFRVALSLAQAGDVNLAQQEMRAISDQPASGGSSWVQPARDFTRMFVTPQSLARACQAAGRCYPYLSMTRLLRLTSTAYRSQFFSTLDGYGVPIVASGLIDVDRNGLSEHWFTLPLSEADCGEQCLSQLWLVVQSNRRFWGYALGPVAVQTEINFSSLPAIDGLPVFALPGQIEQPLVMVRNPASGMVEIAPVCEVFRSRLDLHQANLVRGVSIYSANRSLTAWASADLSACSRDQLLTDLARLNYLRGLSFELMGSPALATDAYAAATREGPGSLYALLAQSKLNE